MGNGVKTGTLYAIGTNYYILLQTGQVLHGTLADETATELAFTDVTRLSYAGGFFNAVAAGTFAETETLPTAFVLIINKAFAAYVIYDTPPPPKK
jgi:hypothetical protein